MARSLETRIKQAAIQLGFDDCRITNAQLPKGTKENLQTYLQNNHHGTMEWMIETFERRANPKILWPQVKSVVVLAMNYGPPQNPADCSIEKNSGQISVYARHRDYHDIVKGRLKTLAGKLASWSNCDLKVFVDTAPVMEKPLAAKAGTGWQGKHTNLVSRKHGSWLFLGSIFTTAALAPDSTESDNCGSCRACLDVCPTNAFPAPYQLDARRCISYLTIENKGPIPVEFRRAIANRVFGCDDCLAVCPWNKFAATAREIKLLPRQELLSPSLAFLARLDDAAFRKFFSASPIKRIGRDRFLRNVLVAIGNSDDPAFLPLLENLLKEPNPIVRGAAIWALRMIGDADMICSLRQKHYAGEEDEQTRAEWDCELDGR